MITQISLVIVALFIIALALVVLVSSLLIVAFKAKKAVDLIQADLHQIYLESTNIISRLSDFSADIKNKSQSLNFLLKPFSFLNRESFSRSSPNQPQSTTVLQLITWAITGLILVKKAKEVIKHDTK